MDARSERIARRFDIPMLVAALLVIPAIVLEESDVGPGWRHVATALNWGIWIAFAVELVVMLWVVPNRGRWAAQHPLEIAIVVLTPPFLPASLQAARVFRLLRVLRLARLAQLSRRLLSTEGVRDAAVFALITVMGGGAAYTAVEKVDAHGHQLTTWDGIWWALTTVTTVGYGDLSPQTTGGRMIGAVVMLVGIGFVALLTAAAAQRFLRQEKAEREELRLLRELLDRVERLERAS